MRRMCIAATIALVSLWFTGAAELLAATLTPPPLWSGGHLLGPARQAAELVRASFSYDSSTQRLKLKLGENTVEMKRGSSTATVNGRTITLPIAPRMLNGTIYVPLKTLFSGLGLQIKPHGETAWILCNSKLCIRLEVPKRPE